MKNLLSTALLSFPCPMCGTVDEAKSANAICAACVTKLQFIQPPCCPGCGGELDGILQLCRKCLREDKRPWQQATALLYLNGEGQNLVQRFKYNNHPELARPLGELLAEKLLSQSQRADWLVPIPLHWSRYLTRGYNQSRLTGAIIAARCGMELHNILVRRQRTRQQAKLTRAERKINLSNAFFMKRGANCKNRTILLFDDVLTTGATLSAACKVLLNAGARRVDIAVIARR